MWIRCAALLAVLPAMAPADELGAAKASFAKWDQRLNRDYAALKAALDETRFGLLQEDQRDWVRYRDYLAKWGHEGEGQKAESQPGYWDTAAGLTKSRLTYLAGWKGVGEDGQWSGIYSDGVGGHLRMLFRAGKLHFVLEVVRGPTHHLGYLAGRAEVNDQIARFATTAEGEDQPTWISFLNHDDAAGRVRIITANDRVFLGARAYFIGSYLRVGLLDDQGKAALLEEIREGP